MVGAFEGGEAGAIDWDAAILPDGSVRQAAAAALAAARAAAGSGKPRLRYVVKLPGHRGELHGHSIGLALGVLFAAYEAAAAGQPAYVPSTDQVFVGGLGADAGVLEVAESSVALKLRAANAAGMRQCFLPAGNGIEPTWAAESSPGCTLQLETLRVRSLGELLSRSELVRVPAKDVRSRVHRSARTSRAALAALGAIALAFGWLGLQYNRPWTLDETTVTLAGDSQSAEAELAGFPSLHRSWEFGSRIGQVEKVTFTKDGPLRILVNTLTSGSQPAHLFCLDPRTRQTVWNKDFSHWPPMPADYYESNSFDLSRFVMADLDADGVQDLIILLTATPGSASFVLWLDARGQIRSSYAHGGTLVKPVVTVLDGDGKPEVLMAGTYNGDGPLPWNGTLVALDATHFSAWPRGWMLPPGLTGPHDSSYATIVFPPIPEHCRLTNANGCTTGYLTVSRAFRPSAITVPMFTQSPPGILITLDDRLRPIGAVPEDAFVPLVRKGLVDHVIREDFTEPGRLGGYLRRIIRAGPGAR